MALKYLKNTEVNINNVLIMTGDFNIRNKNWDSSYLHYSAHSDILTDIANSFELRLYFAIQQVLIRYADNSNNSNSVIDLMFFQPDLVKVNNYLILPELQYLLDHAPLTVDRFISKEFIHEKQRTIIRNSQKEEMFVSKLTNALGNIDMTDLTSIESLKNTVQEYIRILNSSWHKFSKNVDITKHSKAW